MALGTVACGSAPVDAVITTPQAGAVAQATSASTMRFRMDVDQADLPFPLNDVGFEGVIDGPRGRSRFTITMAPSGVIEYIQDGPRIYRQRDGGPWTFVDARPGQEVGMDPNVLLSELRTAGALRDLGAGEVRGIPVTHYRAAPAGGTTLDVWVDEAGRAVRIHTSPHNQPTTVPTTHDPGDGLRATVGMQAIPSTIEYWDFGLPVEIEPPVDAVPE